MNELLKTIADARALFLDSVAEIRPELHRYCTRMTGSIFDGEDVVQETLARAHFALAEMESPPPLRAWLFRIAHNVSLDFLRRSDHRLVDSVEDLVAVAEMNQSTDSEPDGEQLEIALKIFTALSPVQRSALALKDVLGLSLEETASTMGLTVPAVKGALTRARLNVAAARTSGSSSGALDVDRLRSYADLFNARNWDGLRALFGEETQLDVVSRYQRRGPSAANYFTQYSQLSVTEDLRMEVGTLEGQPVLAMFRPASSSTAAYFIQLTWSGAQISRVRDFRYVPYIAREAHFMPSNLSLTLSFEQSPAEVFAAINDVRGWWGPIDGRAEAVGDQFVYQHGDLHRSTQQLTQLEPDKKVVWRVNDAHLSFAKNPAEWKGTEIIFEIAKKAGGSQLTFTHQGLTPECDCYEMCSKGWGFYVGESLRKLISTGVGQPD